MTIDVKRSGFSLCQKRPHQTDEIWGPVYGDAQLFQSVKKLYAPDGEALESDLPFVEMLGDSPIKY
jgi:hypothetical protein